MTHGYPRWFRLLFAVIMLTVCVVFITQLIAQHQAVEQIALLQSNVDLQSKRLVKQQKEYAEYMAEFPQVQAELERVAPIAKAAADQEAELRARRAALRSEQAELESQLAQLQEQVRDTNATALADHEAFNRQIQDAIDLLDAALEALQN